MKIQQLVLMGDDFECQWVDARGGISSINQVALTIVVTFHLPSSLDLSTLYCTHTVCPRIGRLWAVYAWRGREHNSRPGLPPSLE